MKASLSTTALCQVLGVCGYVSITGPHAFASPVDSPTPRITLRIELKDGSSLLGEPKTESLAFRVHSSRISSPVNDIREIAFQPDNETARLELLNGDVLTCIPLFESLPIRTAVGELSLQVGTLRVVSVLNHTLYVSPRGTHAPGFTSWAVAASNIQDAVNAARDGDTILVSNGTYFVAGPITIRKGLTVKSVNGPGATVIDGGLTGRCVFVQHTNAVLDGFAIYRGSMTGDGGGAYVDGGTVRNCDIASNSCVGGWSRGGGIALINGGRLESSRVRDNTGTRGGGVFVGHRGRMTGCTIARNQATGEFAGGVIVMEGGNVEGCHIVSNQATRNACAIGGGVAVLSGGTVRRCRIEYNTASMQGAGAFLSGAEPCVLKESVVYRNLRPSGSGCGGGVFLQGAVIEDSLVARNYDPMYGGGVAVAAQGTSINCTIAMNSSPHGNEAYEGQLINSIVFNEKPDNLVNGSSCSNCWTSAEVPGTNNLVKRALFTDCLNDNFTLDPPSALQGIGCPMSRLTNIFVGVDSVPLVFPPRTGSPRRGVPHSAPVPSGEDGNRRVLDK